jgi:transcriptional regulator CtsR
LPQNTSDIIESYLLDLLKQANEIEIRRMDMATLFNVVPSQINYVINTRFTLPKGYNVESKRGGGGYIRIVKIKIADNYQMIESMKSSIGEELSQEDAKSFLGYLYQEEAITKREAHLMKAVLVENLLEKDADKKQVDILRAKLMQSFLTHLVFE